MSSASIQSKHDQESTDLPVRPNPQPTAVAGPTRRTQLVEVCVFLSLIVPSLVLSLFIAHGQHISFLLAAAATICRDLSLVGLILFFLWQNQESLARIGWKTTGLLRETLIGVALFPFIYGTATLIELAGLDEGLSGLGTHLPSFLTPLGPSQYILAFLMVVVVAIAEETIFRGYLLLRFTNTSGSATVAVLLSSLVFAIGHGYEGIAGLITVGTLGLMLALIYLWRRNIVAPVIIHFLLDFLNIILLPALLH